MYPRSLYFFTSFTRSATLSKKSHPLFFVVIAAVASAVNASAATIADTTLIRSHLIALTKTAHARAYYNLQQLNESAEYIKNVFSQYADTVFMQEYFAHGNIYRNVICSFGAANRKRIIVGAHYDVCGEQPGADDNASGVVGLLELARMLHGQKLSRRIDLVAYPLEEPPYFGTTYMGSYVHASSLASSGADVYGMVCFDMIGYFSDEKKSQSYPLGFLSVFYGNRANYITLIRRFKSGSFARRFTRYYRSANTIRAKKFAAPATMPGISYSDHSNYWKFGYSAVLITDLCVPKRELSSKKRYDGDTRYREHGECDRRCIPGIEKIPAAVLMGPQVPALALNGDA